MVGGGTSVGGGTTVLELAVQRTWLPSQGGARKSVGNGYTSLMMVHGQNGVNDYVASTGTN